jgi:hypothetical protein
MRISGVFWTSQARYLDCFDSGQGQSEPLAELGGKHLIGQNSWGIRIVREFDYIECAVRSSHQVGLRVAAHPADMLLCIERRNHLMFWNFDRVENRRRIKSDSESWKRCQLERW